MSTTGPSVDPRTLHFSPLGLRGPLRPEDSERLLQEEMDALQLGPLVPQVVTKQFEKLKALYVAGLYSYESFTHAERDAYRVLEVALKVRVLHHYARAFPLVGDGRIETVECRTFDDLRAALGSRGRGRRLLHHPLFNGSLTSLLRWARHEGYFYGQHNRIREEVTPKLRNDLQHSEFDHLLMLPEVSRTIGLHHQWIQRLWGYDTPGGNAYGGPITRHPTVIGRWDAEARSTWFALDVIGTVVDCDRPGGVFHVVLAAGREHVADWRPGSQQTATPIDWLWGPGTWNELAAAIRGGEANWASDAIDTVDRAFFVPVVEVVVGAPLSEDQLIAYGGRPAGEEWHVVRADWPGVAHHHVRELVGTCQCDPGSPHRSDGPCRHCASESLLAGARRDEMVAFTQAGNAQPPVRRQAAAPPVNRRHPLT